MSENGEIYTAGKNFTLPPALTGWTNSTSDKATQLICTWIFICSMTKLKEHSREICYKHIGQWTMSFDLKLAEAI